MTLTKIVSVEYLDGYRLRLSFGSGASGVHDFSDMVVEPGPMMEPLRDQAMFRRAFLELGALVWPSGFDIAPEWMRREMAARGELTDLAAE